MGRRTSSLFGAHDSRLVLLGASEFRAGLLVTRWLAGVHIDIFAGELVFIPSFLLITMGRHNDNIQYSSTSARLVSYPFSHMLRYRYVGDLPVPTQPSGSSHGLYRADCHGPCRKSPRSRGIYTKMYREKGSEYVAACGDLMLGFVILLWSLGLAGGESRCEFSQRGEVW